MISFPMLISFDANNNIISIHFPDLQKTFPVTPEDIDRVGITKFAQAKLEEYIKILDLQNKIVPMSKKLKDYRKSKTDNKEIWTKIFIDYDPHEGFFQRSLPIIGIISTILSAGCYAFTSFMAIELTTGTSKWSKFVSGFGAVVGLLFTFIIYMFSGTTSDLSYYGYHADNKFKEKQVGPNPDLRLNTESKQATCLSSSAKISLVCTLYPLVVLNTVFNSITLYQETMSVGEKAQKQDPFFTTRFIFILALITLITNAISVLSFEARFAKVASNAAEDKLKKEITSSSEIASASINSLERGTDDQRMRLVAAEEGLYQRDDQEDTNTARKSC